MAGLTNKVLIVYSPNRVPIRLTEERWAHVEARHPEMVSLRDHVLETVADPDELQAGDLGVILAIRWYVTTPLTSKFLVAALREVSAVDGFVVTANLARRLSDKRPHYGSDKDSGAPREPDLGLRRRG